MANDKVKELFLYKIGKALKMLRIENEYTIDELSKKTGLAVGTISQIERGTRNFTVSVLFIIIDVYNYHIADLVSLAYKKN